MAHGADELFEFEREVGAVSPDRHRGLTHVPGPAVAFGLSSCSGQGRDKITALVSPDVLETSANGVILAQSCDFV